VPFYCSTCQQNSAICDLLPEKRDPQLFGELDTFTGEDALAHDTCAATMTFCDWATDLTPVTWCCLFSTVCDGIGGGAYCCLTCELPLQPLND
jgi:hypothetical protein